MPPPWSRPARGTWHELVVDSKLLRGNRLGDPHERPLWVYTPPGFEAGAALPSVYAVQGYTGQLDMWRNRSPWRPTFPELVDSLFEGPDAPPPCVVVLVDCWTSLGGSQFVDSPGTGRYHSYLCDEVVPFVQSRFGCVDGASGRAIMGKSSGGYGAIVTAMLRPDLFGGFATHAGDGLFEHSMMRAFPACARALRDHYEGSWDRFWADFRSRPAFTRPWDHDLVITYAMGACYSAEADGTVVMPFDPLTGRLIPDVWERWLRWDPCRMAAVPAFQTALRSQVAIWIDAGSRDEWFLDLAAADFRRAVAEAGVPDDRVHFELFDGGHGGIEYRYPLALRFLADRLSRGPAV